MNWLGLFAGLVMAAESVVISPLADDYEPPKIMKKPETSFGQLTSLFVEPEILGVQIEVTPTPTPKPMTKTTQQSSYKIAILGDSMTDTLGPDGAGLGDRLKNIYPKTNFEILNYGVGGTNIDYGLERLTNDYQYLGRSIPSLISQQPEVVVIESFGYNPFAQDNNYLDRHWLALAALVDALKNTKIVLAATIAPNADVFGDGILNWSAEQKQQKVKIIKEYLENTIKFAQSQHLPLANAYNPSLDQSGNGKLVYINSSDHIHYSETGRNLMAQKITEAIIANKLLE